MAQHFGAKVHIEAIYNCENGKCLNAHVLYRQEGIKMEVRVSFLGDGSSGKSSLVASWLK
jgi:GTPase SAR1 family protein